MFIDAAAAAEQRDEIAPFNWSSSIRSPAGQGRIEDIQLARDQSARTNPSLFTTRCSLTDAQSPFGVNFGLGRAQLRGPLYLDEPTSRV
jgi:hypothetical protein